MEKIVLFGQLKDTVFVEDYLRSIANQTYDKSAVHLFFDVSALPRPARLAVAGFLYREAEMYGSVLELVARGENDAQRRSLEYASDRNAHYFAAAQNVILHPATIERLLALGHEIVAPMLMSLDTGSNFRTAVREGDGLLAVERRDPILRYEDKGVHQVTAVDLCYLVRRDCVHRFERDGGGADPLCRCQIPQFVDNTHNYGALLTYSDATPAADIVELDFRNNKHFFLNLPHSGKRAVVCDADWLQEFIAVEHYYLIKLLYNEYGFDIVNGRRLDLGDPGFGDDLGTYDVVLTAYHARCRIPLDHVSAYKIYRMDDLENNPWYDDMCRFHMAHSDLVVSPYAYTLRRFFQHPNVAWIPYSCALEGCDGYEDIRFNADPTPKVLVSGNLAATYELRRYAATLEDERLEKMPHPGYYQPRGGEPDRPVRTRYFQILNEYLCCFTDALVYRYVLLKNFEISSVGALLLTERSIEPEMTALGFVDYETCIFCGRDDFLDKVAWITDPQNRPQVDAIRRAGMRLVRERHMTQHRAGRLGALIAALTPAETAGRLTSVGMTPAFEASSPKNNEITLFAKLSEEVLVDDFLRSVFNQTYDKCALHLFLDVTRLPRSARDTVTAFARDHAAEYGSIFQFFDSGSSDSESRALAHASNRGTHYLAVAQNAILHPDTVRRLRSLDREVVAPMLTSLGPDSTFCTDVDDAGNFKQSERQDRILRYEAQGIHDVAAINACYLVRDDCLRHVADRVGNDRDEHATLSDRLRRQNIPQFVDNTQNYGVLLTYSDDTPRQEIAEIDHVNNKAFFLGLAERSKGAVICDAEWLASYVIVEHFYLFKLLKTQYGFDIINCRRLHTADPAFSDDLNTYDVIFTAYHAYSRIPLDRVSAYKIYRMDDLENDPNYDDICRFHMAHSDLVVSPYAYTLRRFFQHPNVAWIPYSCALEGCDGYEDIRFNADPTPKVLVSGNLAATYELRRYAATLEDERLEKMPHPGYYQPRGGEPDRPVRTRYFQILNEYLCCFTDALVYRYVLLKNFEISSVGALLLTERSIEPEMTALGFVDYETCIFCDRDDFLDKVAWITDPQNRPQVDAIRRAGMRLVRDRHMTQHRATQLGGLAGPMSLDHSTAVSRIANVSLATAA